MINILIVDKHIEDREHIKKILLLSKSNLNIFEATNEEDALKISIKNKIDIFFVEIFLEDSSGLDLSLKLRDIPKYTLSWIIFTTYNMKYILDCFKKVHCYDYILKPYDDDEIIDIINILTNSNDTSTSEITRQYLTLTIDDIIFKIFIDDIFFIEVFGKTSIIHTIKEKYIVQNVSLKKLSNMINNCYFVKCHKSFLVNITKIKKIENISYKKSNIYFDNYSEIIPLSYNFRKNMLKWMK